MHRVANIIEKWCAESFDEPPIVAMDVNSMSTCRHFVRAGLGWSILTYMGLGSCKDRDIYVSPLRSKMVPISLVIQIWYIQRMQKIL